MYCSGISAHVCAQTSNHVLLLIPMRQKVDGGSGGPGGGGGRGGGVANVYLRHRHIRTLKPLPETAHYLRQADRWDGQELKEKPTSAFPTTLKWSQTCCPEMSDPESPVALSTWELTNRISRGAAVRDAEVQLRYSSKGCNKSVAV